MKTFTAILLFAAFASCSADISLKLRENDFSHINDQGEYHFGFNDGHQARQEERSAEGVVRGAYRYIDANGEVQTVTYTADKHNGFLASGSNIPKIGRIPESGDSIKIAPAGVIVEDTPEVREARAAHLEAHRVALNGGNIIGQSLPVQVQYTPEVAAARAQHINALNQEYLRSGNYYPITYASQPAVQYVIPGAQYHPDYLPYAAL
ncbi:cuticle protein-like [Episyrphus balteatus]|uniref:cuticle protein-like n=1 Tax=Episyrphus balteatus TaxID=286459 RepID=UPI0024865F58|nr:cuticle protein-like [Episyrphus balteatus]